MVVQTPPLLGPKSRMRKEGWSMLYKFSSERTFDIVSKKKFPCSCILSALRLDLISRLKVIKNIAKPVQSEVIY